MWVCIHDVFNDEYFLHYPSFSCLKPKLIAAKKSIFSQSKDFSTRHRWGAIKKTITKNTRRPQNTPTQSPKTHEAHTPDSHKMPYIFWPKQKENSTTTKPHSCTYESKHHKRFHRKFKRHSPSLQILLHGAYLLEGRKCASPWRMVKRIKIRKNMLPFPFVPNKSTNDNFLFIYFFMEMWC